ncbi:Gfo/Idh/MocA family oxidoreductase [Marinomonas sp. M1K-6]|uniref:Gfo/Idh/MocA family oxidoreductase n=1 Tax=Marinomonas profundi TaxID=2726122 RepID=A0A847R0P3_9GAMM|nr:Gfo/Idh/MocA family oxidoreductase [Marinomonas profundi]NLQ17095.1 Gfo/Idh/MocA family oxidoreductase [Marinomonas profundi]UDV04708.1 Gfo/Idh/MocA family oxidoreductase [Marinomonas profundi]
MTILRWGMVGGGEDAFIGDVHRMAARLDGGYQLVAGCFSSNLEKTKTSAIVLGVAEDRAYADFHTMAETESQRKDGIEVVSIVTPNFLHYDNVAAFLNAGIAVICEKPLTVSLAQAQALQTLAKERNTFLGVTYNYIENPMVKVARERVKNGELGELLMIDAYYLQDWLAVDIEHSGQKQAAWRTDPAKAGRAGCLGDIAIHAYNLLSYLVGYSATSVNARLTSFVEGRKVDDHADIQLSYSDRLLQGRVLASQVMTGHENDLGFRLTGRKATLEWRQEDPNVLWFRPLGAPAQRLTRNGPDYPESLNAWCRVPAGHPEGYLEAFANVYQNIRLALLEKDTLHYSNIDQAVKDMAFVEACLQSHDQGNWREVE